MHLKGVVLESVQQVLDSTLASGGSLNEKTHCGEHGKASVGNFPRLKGIVHLTSLEVKRVESEVTWSTVSGLATSSGSNTRDHLDNHDHDKTERNVLWVGVPQLPEGIQLVLGSGSLTSWSWSENFNLNNTGDSKHCKAAMLEFGLAEPVEVDSDIINVR